MTVLRETFLRFCWHISEGFGVKKNDAVVHFGLSITVQKSKKCILKIKRDLRRVSVRKLLRITSSKSYSCNISPCWLFLVDNYRVTILSAFQFIFSKIRRRRKWASYICEQKRQKRGWLLEESNQSPRWLERPRPPALQKLWLWPSISFWIEKKSRRSRKFRILEKFENREKYFLKTAANPSYWPKIPKSTDTITVECHFSLIKV